MTPRALAFMILGQVLSKGDHTNQLLSIETSRHGISGRDRGFLWELTLGVIRWITRLDWSLSRHIKEYEALPLEVKNLLRLSAYQLTFMDKVPPYAAVNEAMELAKEKCNPKYHGLVNAVMRKIAQNPYPGITGQKSALKMLSLAHAHPIWMVERWKNRLGMEETLKLTRANNRPAPFAAWVNTHLVQPNRLRKVLKAQGIECKPHSFMDNVIIIITPTDITQLPQFQDGLIHLQDPASALAVMILDPKPEEIVLDACAAPGTKTVQVAWAMENKGRLIACDIHPQRVKQLEETCRRGGVQIADILLGDVVEKTEKLHFNFDKILLDAPCSDLGTLRRHPELKWRRKEEDIQNFSQKQRRLLSSLMKRLKPTGTIVYSVCSPEPEEGEEVIESILRKDATIKLVDFEVLLPEMLRPFYKKAGMLTLYPHNAQTDGFFLCKLTTTDRKQ